MKSSIPETQQFRFPCKKTEQDVWTVQFYQIDSDAALLPYLIHQLGSAHECSGI